MEIVKIEPYIVEHKLNEPFYFSQWEYDRRSTCIVKITTDEGIYGWGEGYGPSAIVKSGIEFLAPGLIGLDPLHHERIWNIMFRSSFDFVRRGVLAASLSAIDVAVWDLKGKILNLPVSTLLGGKIRDKVQVYATGLYFTNGENLSQRLSEEAIEYREQGFNAVKMKVGLGISEDVKNVEAVRTAIGDNIELMVDSNHAYSKAEAAELIRHITPLQIGWFEEPVSPEDYDGYAELRRSSSIPIAGGECEYFRSGFRQLADMKCIDIAQPDICAAGGLTEVTKIIALVNTFGINVTPHCWGSGIAFSAALHLMSTVEYIPGRKFGADPILEMDRSENPLRDSLSYPVYIPQDGYVYVPESSGLGIDIDKDRLKEYKKE